MADIIPDTEIQFFRNIHIDPDHENTIYFPSESAKDAYFDNIPHNVASKCYYQRERRNYCRVEIPLSQLLNRQYMRFKNSQFEDKWFYAFVDDVEYINNITTEVHYTLDPVMTWMGQFDLDECFIERQHTETDNIGDNIVPEPITVNHYISNTTFSSGQAAPQRTNLMSTSLQWEYLVVIEPKGNTDPPAGDLMGIYSGLCYVECPDVTALTTYIEGLSALDQPRVQGIFYIPKFLIPDANHPAPRSFSLQLQKPIAGSTPLGDYVHIKNNKLYTYPYNFIKVNNTEGGQFEFAFEFFASNVAEFTIKGITGEQTQITCTPYRYKNTFVSQTFDDANVQLMMKDFPMCAWTIDTYRAYLAQQLISIPTEVIGAGVMGMIGRTPSVLPTEVGYAGTRYEQEREITPGEYRLQNMGMGMGRAAAMSISHAVAGAVIAAQRPNEARGVNAPLLSCAGQTPYKDFWFYRISVRGDEAKRIDDYFTMFGYAIDEVGKPNMCARPYYTYIKTIGCHVNTVFTGADDVRYIEECFNRGMRLWNGANLGTTQDAYIGNYSTLDNSPTVSP